METEGSVQLRDENFIPVVKHGVQTLQNLLTGQVLLVQQDPLALLHGIEKRSIPPLEVSSVSSAPTGLRCLSGRTD